MKTIIAITGKMASGKGHVSGYLARRYGAAGLSSSFGLHEALDAFGIPRSRGNLQTLALFLSSTFGGDTLGAAVEKRVEALSESVVALNGIRREGDMERLKKHHRFFLWFIDAETDKRYERYCRRDQYVGDGAMTSDDFTAHERVETELKQDYFKTISDRVIPNNGTLLEFERELDRAYQETIDRSIDR